MSVEIDTVNRIFSDAFKNDSDGFLEEEGENMRRKLIKRGVDDREISIFRLDQNNNKIDIFPYLKSRRGGGINGLKRICDFVIFVFHANKLFVLLIEMKKGRGDPKEQLDLTVPLIEFIFNRVEILGLGKTEYTIRKIGISDRVGKRTTSYRGLVQYDGNNYVKLDKNEYLYINELLH